MIVFLNGRFVPEEEAVVSVFDRGFTYGDGLFETMRVSRGRPFLWEEHLRRFEAGARALSIAPSHSAEAMRAAAGELIRLNQCPEAILRMQLSRGAGARGYSIQGAGLPTLVMSVHPVPGGDDDGMLSWRLAISSLRLEAGSPLCAWKTSNKLIQILARAEAESKGCHDALMLNAAGDIAETSSSNLFWIAGDKLMTPPLRAGALPGVTRGWVMRQSVELGVTCEEQMVRPDQLFAADGCFATNSGLGIIEVEEIQGRSLRRSELCRRIHQHYVKAMAALTKSV